MNTLLAGVAGWTPSFGVSGATNVAARGTNNELLVNGGERAIDDAWAHFGADTGAGGARAMDTLSGGERPLTTLKGMMVTNNPDGQRGQRRLSAARATDTYGRRRQGYAQRLAAMNVLDGEGGNDLLNGKRWQTTRLMGGG